MTTQIDIDEATGLPALPGGHYWRVEIYRTPYAEVPTMSVSIRKRVRRFFYTTIASDEWMMGTRDPRGIEAERTGWDRVHPYVPLDPAEYDEFVYGHAVEVLAVQEKNFAAQAFEARFIEARKRLTGNYPPKKIGGTA